MYTSLQIAFADEDKAHTAMSSPVLNRPAERMAGVSLDDPTAYTDLVCELLANQ